MLNIFFLLLLLFHEGCFKIVPRETRITPLYGKRSIIGITGVTAQIPYVEIYYTRKNTDTTNQLVHLWVSPPFIFGDDSIVAHQIEERGALDGKRSTFYNNFRFDSLGDSYLKIINHAHYPIEMFVATNQNTKTYSEAKIATVSQAIFASANSIYYHPRPIYQNAPIYYLLFPHKTPNKTGMNIINPNQSLNISYTPTQIGNINISKPWTVDKVMALYRAEYHHSKDTVLYAHYKGGRVVYFSTENYVLPPRISSLSNIVSNYKQITYNPDQFLSFYAVIQAMDSFESVKNKSYPMTNIVPLPNTAFGYWNP